MAFVVKNANRAKQVGKAKAYVSQWIQVSRPTLALPQTTNEQLFRIYGGRVLVRLLLGEVTTVIQNSDPVAKVAYAALTDAAALVGTEYDIASTLDLTSDEVGTLYTVIGDGTAIQSGNQVAGSVEIDSPGWVAAQGQIVLICGASKTGNIKWDIWYQPLDDGAYVVSVDTATVKIS